MIYYALHCPNCGLELFDARTVRDLTIFTMEMDAVGVSAICLKCPRCHKKWGIIIAADEHCWMLSVVKIANLPQEYKRIRNAMERGMDVEQLLRWTKQYKIRGNIAS